MAFSLGIIQPQGYIGTPFPTTIATCTPRLLDPKAVPLSIDWSAYGASTTNQRIAVAVNLIGQAVQAPLDKIRSVYIDNTFSPVPIYVYFPDTQFVAVCPPNSIAMLPVFTNIQNLIVYAEGFITGNIPKTTIHLSNVDRDGFIIPASFDAPTIGTYIGLLTSSAVSTVYSFPTAAIGVARFDRLVVLSWQTMANSAVNVPSPTQILIGGVVANQPTGAGNAAGTGSAVSGIAYLRVPAGSTAPINFTLNNPANGISIGVWTIINQDNDSPYDFGSVNGASAISFMSLNLQMPAGSFGIFGANVANAVGNLWTGAQSKYAQTIIAGFNNTMEGASIPSLIDQSRTISINANTLSGAIWF